MTGGDTDALGVLEEAERKPSSTTSTTEPVRHRHAQPGIRLRLVDDQHLPAQRSQPRSRVSKAFRIAWFDERSKRERTPTASPSWRTGSPAVLTRHASSGSPQKYQRIEMNQIRKIALLRQLSTQ
ncbi:hypothetical protein [Rhodococcoides fascians]|uniref:hypothetical protein n=1 Tax=Rhodococcoides fascians TaxID=1828 RepID=UPI000AD29F70|nr:hypothetical protein [Rhodococcus fascians]